MPDVAGFKIIFTNGDNPAEFMECHAPPEVGEKLAPRLARLAVVGASHEEIQYEGTGNHALDFELTFDALSELGHGRFDVPGADGIEDARRFLLGFCYAERGAQSIVDARPPPLVLVWPRMWSLVTVMPDIEFRHTRFSSSGAATLTVAKIKLEERRTLRLFRGDVIARGTRRI